MTPPGGTGTNLAADSAQVGMQAGIVHGDVHYYAVSPDPSRREKFEAGVRYLESGAAGQAWRLISEAVAAGHVTNRVCFHWLLALVSGRTRRELSDEEATYLRNADRFPPLSGDDSWADAVRTVRRLLDAAGKPDADIRLLVKELDELRPLQRDMILRHLEVFLHGPIRNQMWHLALRRARDGQMARNREDRVWKFFQPKPAPPRVRQAAPVTISGPTWLVAVTGMVVSVAAAAHLGLLLVQNGRVAAVLAYLLGVAGGCLAARYGAEWRFRARRRRAKDDEHAMVLDGRTGAPPDAFARRVAQRFDYYFAKYVPRDMDREVWLAWTTGIRRSMRDEVAEAYHENPPKVEAINWLLRHRALDAADRWQKGTLWNYRRELATPLYVQAAALFGALACAAGGVAAASAAVQAEPLGALRSIALLLAAGSIGGRAWLRITSERRRHAADESAAGDLAADSAAAFARWKDRLADTPDEGEMATWLDCDRKVLLSEALRHYQLAMDDVVAHAFIEARSGSATRARVPGGPWRYRKYQLIIFLLTCDGVRQLTATLDFAHGTFHDRVRMNYRFEAVAAVRVRQADNQERTFELSLLNGKEINVKVIEPEVEELRQAENPEDVSEVTLDAAGLRHTLHVLEGIAAEGKAWMTAERRRGKPHRRKASPPAEDEEGPEARAS